jgi:hypothetical protein
MLINRASLSKTLDAINAAHFDGRTLAAVERGRTARWIAGRQGLPGAYGGTFAGFPSERSRGMVLFTGERIASASARHILGYGGISSRAVSTDTKSDCDAVPSICDRCATENINGGDSRSGTRCWR